MITLEILQAIPFQEMINSCDTKECKKYMEIFDQRIKENGEAHEHYDALMLINSICSMYLKPYSETSAVFAPMYVINQQRSFIPQDLSKDLENILIKFVFDINDPELKSRIADVLWVRRCVNGFKFAKIAIDNYIMSANRLSSEGKNSAVSRFNRAINISKELGNSGGSSLEKSLKAVLESLKKIKTDETGNLHYGLYKLLVDNNHGSIEEIMGIGEEYIDGKQEDGFSIRDYYALQIKALQKHGLHERVDIIQSYMAKSFIKQADESTRAIDECWFIERAVQTYRKYAGNEAIISKLQQRISVKQKNILNELKPIAIEFDAKTLIEQSKKAVQGKNLFETLKQFVLVINVYSKENLKEMVIEEAKAAPLSTAIGWSQIDRTGKTVSKVDGLNTHDGEDQDFTEIIYRHFVKLLTLDVHTGIIPALAEIKREHFISEEDINRLITNHPLIPDGYEMFFARGLLAGFYGDFPLACLLLVPQLEACFRNILIICGEVTYTMDGNGIQKEMPLDLLLKHNKLHDFFSETTLFTLRALLIEKNGCNFRHELAHGILTYPDYFTTTAVYAWWFILRMIMVPHIYHHINKEKESSPPDISDND